MMKRLACAFAVVAMAMTGCGTSLCDDFDDTAKSLPDKVKACPNLSEGITYEEPTEAERQQCEESLEACTDSDKEALNKFIDCINDLPDCTTATEQTFATSFLACAAPLANVSDACGGFSTDEVIRKGLELSKAR